MLRNRVLPRAFERLERCARKLARTVLRGGDGSNAVSLPDKGAILSYKQAVEICFWERAAQVPETS